MSGSSVGGLDDSRYDNDDDDQTLCVLLIQLIQRTLNCRKLECNVFFYTRSFRVAECEQ